MTAPIHIKTEQTTPDFLNDFPAPKNTKSYLGIPHSYLFELARDVGESAGFEYISADITMKKEGNRAFMKLFFYAEGSPKYFFVGVRSTYDKSARVGLASGAAVQVCSNLCIFGDDMVILRKHTPNALRDLDVLAERMKLKAKTRFDTILKFCDDTKETPVTPDQGKMIIGAALGNGILTHGMYKESMDHWINPPFLEFEAEQNLWGVYNALTFGAHKAPINQKLSVNAAVSEYINNVMSKKIVLL